MKKIIALVLALALVLVSCAVAFAEVNDNVTVTISGITAGDTLKLYQIAATTYNSTTNQLDWTWNGGLTADDFGFTDEGYTFTQNSAGQAAALAAYNALKSGSFTQAVADGSGVATASVAPGYYVAFVEGSAGSGVVYQRMLINAIQTVDAANNTYVAHATVEAAVKKEPITITKTEEASAIDATQVTTTDGYHIGETIDFTLTTSIPSYPSDSTNAHFIITDDPTGLDDDSSTIVVNVAGLTDPAVKDRDYTVADDADGKGFSITFVKDFILAHPAAAVTVTYSAVLEGPVDLSGKTRNDATITYNPNPSEDTDVTPPGPHDEQNIYGVVVYKYAEKADATDHTQALPGASFKLVEANSAGTAPADPEVVLKTGTTDASGYISWSGLKNGTYYLIETSAPAGYRLDATPRQVVLNSTNANGDDPTTAGTETYFLNTEIPNTAGTSLPSTGGIGTTIFYVLGGLLVVGAAVILVARRKASN